MVNKLKIEDERLRLQEELDSQKSQKDRNRMGQFSTPTHLADEILGYAKSLIGNPPNVDMLDPACGTGAFFSALLKNIPSAVIGKINGFEIDSHYSIPAKKLWRKNNISIETKDFTTIVPPNYVERFNLLICNPPYCRHQHVGFETKNRLKRFISKTFGISVSGLASLYLYFIFLSHLWLKNDAISGWLIPTVFMDVNFGKALKEYLLKHVQLLHIHRFDANDLQFSDALVSSSIIWFKNRRPERFSINFSFGGTLSNPKYFYQIPYNNLKTNLKWSNFFRKDAIYIKKNYKLSDLFIIKRGVQTGSNNFFIVNKDTIHEFDLPLNFLRPILPKQSSLQQNLIEGDKNGIPIIENKLYLLDCDLTENIIRDKYPTLWGYLKIGIESGIAENYTCSRRTPWYSQEKRKPPLFFAKYMGRKTVANSGNPFKFFLNDSSAIATNSYMLIYPKPEFEKLISAEPDLRNEIFNCLENLPSDLLLNEARVYGGGLYKLEPNEFLDVSANEIIRSIPSLKRILVAG
jgi:adenine-specific DNA-methyltransferase